MIEAITSSACIMQRSFPMSSIAQVSETMQTILTSRAKALERETGFVERSTVHLDGPIFSQTAVLTWMQRPDASYSQLRHTAASLGGAREQPSDRATFWPSLGAA